MGEHHLDKPYDVLCNEIAAERAQLKAMQEAEALRYEICKPKRDTAKIPLAHSIWWESGVGISGSQK